MCQQCLDAVRTHWPNLPDEHINTLLMSATSFPFGESDKIEQQVSHLSRVTGQDLGFALRIADFDLRLAMQDFDE